MWEERFKSVLVEGSPAVLLTVAGYIDLNPVRAKLLDDPQKYRWCGYAEAMAGQRLALEGVRAVMSGAEQGAEDDNSLAEALAQYRTQLFATGEEGREGTDADGRPLRRGLPREQVLAVLQNRGQVALEDYLHVRVRYFVDGKILGTREFVDRVFQAFRSQFGPQRQNGARPMRGLRPTLYAVRSSSSGLELIVRSVTR